MRLTIWEETSRLVASSAIFSFWPLEMGSFIHRLDGASGAGATAGDTSGSWTGMGAGRAGTGTGFWAAVPFGASSLTTAAISGFCMPSTKRTARVTRAPITSLESLPSLAKHLG